MKKVVVFVFRVSVVGRDSDTRVVCRDGSDIVSRASIVTPLRRIGATTEQNCGGVVVVRCQGHHGRGRRSRVNADGIRHVVDVVVRVGVPVVQDGRSVGLHEKLAGRKHPSKGVKVDGKRLAQPRQTDGVSVALGREELDGWVILSNGVDVTWWRSISKSRVTTLETKTHLRSCHHR